MIKKINKKGGIFGVMGLIVILIIVVVAGLVGYNLMYAFTSGEETITIKEKWVKYQGDNAKYLVSSVDGQVFQITDTLIKMRFDSSNLYAMLNEGDKCKIITQGFRFPFFSDYKNIIEANC